MAHESLRRLLRVKRLAVLLLALPLVACGEDQTAETRKGDRDQAQGTAQAGELQAGAPEPTASAPRPAEPWRGLQPRAYAAGPILLRFDPDGGFSISEAAGSRKVDGHYAYTDGVRTLSDAKGDVGTAKFPMRCRLDPAPPGFSLSPIEDSCTVFNRVQFKPTS